MRTTRGVFLVMIALLLAACSSGVGTASTTSSAPLSATSSHSGGGELALTVYGCGAPQRLSPEESADQEIANEITSEIANQIAAINRHHEERLSTERAEHTLAHLDTELKAFEAFLPRAPTVSLSVYAKNRIVASLTLDGPEATRWLYLVSGSYHVALRDGEDATVVVREGKTRYVDLRQFCLD